MTPSDRPCAMVTGGARRVGLASARELARAGCDLVITYRASREEAERAASELGALGVGVRLEPLDLTRPDEAARAGDRLARELPRLDVLVHNASVYAPMALNALTPEHAIEQYAVNALSPLLLSSRLAPLLTRSPLTGGGAIVAMADMHVLGRPRKDFAAYAMSKAALVEMVRSLARDLAPRVRVNGVAPGVVAWPERGYESDAGAQEAYLRRVPLARAGTPEDAAGVVRWLALDAPYVTGEIVRVDGGRWLA